MSCALTRTHLLKEGTQFYKVPVRVQDFDGGPVHPDNKFQRMTQCPVQGLINWQLRKYIASTLNSLKARLGVKISD
jgi:hypothetical protein